MWLKKDCGLLPALKEDALDFMDAIDYMFKDLERRKLDYFAVKQYKKYKLASGVICSK